MSRFCGKEPLFWKTAQTEDASFVYLAQVLFKIPVQVEQYLSVVDIFAPQQALSFN